MRILSISGSVHARFRGSSEKTESARAASFLLADQGEIIGHATRWLVGDHKASAPLAPDPEPAFSFVMPIQKSSASTKDRKSVV